jgi:hypothetical protein
MPRLYVGLTWTKAQITSGIPAVVYTGPSMSACKTAAASPVNAGTASQGGYLTNMEFAPKGHPTSRNPAGT